MDSLALSAQLGRSKIFGEVDSAQRVPMGPQQPRLVRLGSLTVNAMSDSADPMQGHAMHVRRALSNQQQAAAPAAYVLQIRVTF